MAENIEKIVNDNKTRERFYTGLALGVLTICSGMIGYRINEYVNHQRERKVNEQVQVENSHQYNSNSPISYVESEKDDKRLSDEKSSSLLSFFG